MKVDFNTVVFEDLDGNPILDQNGVAYVGKKVMANLLRTVKSKHVDSMKAFEKSKDIYENGIADLDSTDQEAFKKFLKEECQCTPNIEAPLLYAFNKVEKTTTKK